jgi:hypothetical protein
MFGVFYFGQSFYGQGLGTTSETPPVTVITQPDNHGSDGNEEYLIQQFEEDEKQLTNELLLSLAPALIELIDNP